MFVVYEYGCDKAFLGSKKSVAAVVLDSVVLASLFSVFIGASKEAVPGEGTRENIAIPRYGTREAEER